MSYKIDPDADDLWKQFSKSRLENIFHAFNELIDNSIASLVRPDTLPYAPLNIHVILNKNKSDDTLEFIIIDNGTGIKNPARALKYSAYNKISSHALNEHGVGMKNSFAWCDEENMNWSIKTKTDENSNTCLIIKAPYTLPNINVIESEEWDSIYPIGTIIKISNICAKKVKRVYTQNYSNYSIKKLGDYFAEEIGVVYSNVLKRHPNLNITVQLRENGRNLTPPVKIKKICMENVPYFIRHERHHIYPIRAKLDGVNEVEIYIDKFVSKDSNDITKEERMLRYYSGRGTKDNGIEFRIEGRLIQNQLFVPFTTFKNHPHRSGIYYRIDVYAKNKKGLPSTYSTKNQLNFNCPKVEAICTIFQREVPENMYGSIEQNNKMIEDEQTNRFYEKRIKHLKGFIEDGMVIVNKPRTVLKSKDNPSLSICPDMTEIYKNKLTIYDMKLKTPTRTNVLQLYWNLIAASAIYKNEKLNEKEIKKVSGVMVAKTKDISENLNNVIKVLNKVQDYMNNPVKIKLTSWEDYLG